MDHTIQLGRHGDDFAEDRPFRFLTWIVAEGAPTPTLGLAGQLCTYWWRLEDTMGVLFIIFKVIITIMIIITHYKYTMERHYLIEDDDDDDL